MATTGRTKYFGTDGIRGHVGDGLIKPDFIMRLGWAAGRVLAQHTEAPILIGKDTRISGYMLESSLEAGLSAAGTNIRLLGPMPTPGVAFLTRSVGAQAGIVISASHNPYYDNGIKFFSKDGKKLSRKIELQIEKQLQSYHCVNSENLGKAKRIVDAPRRYIEFCKSRFLENHKLDDLHIVIDCANGATYHIAPKLFAELGAKITCHAIKPDGLNINQNCGATTPETLQKLVTEHSADIGIALDGDGDRIILVDNKGHIVDGDEILYIISKAKQQTLNGTVVGTVMSNLGLEQAINQLGLGFIRTKVGDRNIIETLNDKNLVLGGESSGHIINLHKTTTGDGLMAALQILEEMLKTQKPLSELKDGIKKFPQKTINIDLQQNNNNIKWSDKPAVNSAVRNAQSMLGRTGRVLLRMSGTEPLLRLTVEGEDANIVDLLAQSLANELEAALIS